MTFLIKELVRQGTGRRAKDVVPAATREVRTSAGRPLDEAQSATFNQFVRDHETSYNKFYDMPEGDRTRLIQDFNVYQGSVGKAQARAATPAAPAARSSTPEGAGRSPESALSPAPAPPAPAASAGSYQPQPINKTRTTQAKKSPASPEAPPSMSFADESQVVRTQSQKPITQQAAEARPEYQGDFRAYPGGPRMDPTKTVRHPQIVHPQAPHAASAPAAPPPAAPPPANAPITHQAAASSPAPAAPAAGPGSTPSPHPPGYSAPAPGSGSPRNIGTPNPSVGKPQPFHAPINNTSAASAPGEPNMLQKIWRGFAGDTSGAAAAAAGKTFNESHHAVFSSKATAEAFGLDDVAPLQAAFGKTGDDFSAPLQKAGLDDKQIAGLQKFQDEVTKVKNEGGQLSEEGMQSMLKNQGELGNMYGGFSRAGATASPNAILRGLGGEGTTGESIMGIAAVAGLAGGANVALGGDFTEGAAVGGGVAFAGRALAKGVAGSMGDIEQSMMKSILGDDTAVAGSSVVIGKKGTALPDLSRHARNQPLNAAQPSKPVQSSIDNYLNDPNAFNPAARKAEVLGADMMGEMTGAQARRQNLEAIKGLGDDAEQLKGFGKKKMRDLLNMGKEKNVAMNNRALVLGGGMLSGVAFTGSADKRDYRRGFNAHRGNRI